MNRKLYSVLFALQLTTSAFAQIDLLKDINPGTVLPQFLDGGISYHGYIYYSSLELWRTDGSIDGTSLVKDLYAGANNNSIPKNFIIYNDMLYFTAVNENGRELWRTDGTPDGTVLVSDINPGNGSSDPRDLVVANGQLFFRAFTPDSGTELWATDGTTAGTYQVFDVNPGPASSASTDIDGVTIIPFAGAVYFTGSNGLPGAGLWKTDGTASGTTLVAQLYDAVPNTYISFLVEANSKLFLGAYDGSAIRLWTSDGSASGTQPLGNMNVSFLGERPNQHQVNGNYLFFSGANNETTNFELWKTDGTLVNTQLVADIDGDAATSSSPINLYFVGSTLYFDARSAGNPDSKFGLYKSTGDVGNYALVSNEFESGYYPMNLLEYNGLLSFSSKSKFYWYDGNALTGVEAGLSGAQNSNTFVELNDLLYFSPSGINKFDGTSVSKISFESYHSSNPSSFTEAGSGVTYFAADDGVNGMELWRSDGTAAGTSMVRNINPAGASNPTQLKMYNGKVYFAANDGTHGIDLWKSDGTDAGTVLVLDAATSGGSKPDGMIVHAGALFVSASGALWKIEGDVAPVQISDAFVTGNTLTSTSTGLYFMGFDRVSYQCSLFKSDGTVAGTTIITNNLAGCLAPSTEFSEIIEFNSKIYFLGKSPAFQSELWVYDGATTGPVKAYADGGPGQVGNFTIVGSTLFFGGTDAAHGYELWKTDGTAANTMLVKDIKEGTSSSLFTEPDHGPPLAPRFSRVSFDGKLYFGADDGTHGNELWVSDGSDAGTTLLNDLAPDATPGTPSSFVAFNDALYFLGSDTYVPFNPNNVYVTNGLSCGTREITSSRYATSNALGLRVIGSKLFVSLKDSRVGQEPFIIDPSQVPPPPDGCGTPPVLFNQPTALVFSDVKNKGMTVSFTPSTQPGAGYIILMRAGQSPYPDDVPVDGTIYQQGNKIGSSVVAGVGPDTTWKLKQMDPETTYYFDVFAYDASHDYLTVNPLAGNQRTGKKDDPQIESIEFPVVTESTITISLTPGDPAGDGYITLMKMSAPSSDVPQDGKTYSIGSMIGNSVVVGFGSSTSVNVGSLNPGTEYFFTVFPYTQSGNNNDYVTASAIAGRQQTTGVVTAVTSKEDRVAYPNPFTDALTIPFYTTGDNTSVHVIIYDQVGRMIAEVVNATFTTGNHEVRWDRSDSQGNKVQSGLYVYCIKAADTGKVTQGLVVAR